LYATQLEGGNGRRAVLTVAATLFYAGVLSFVWGDPVRGPFAFLTHPHTPHEFVLNAGVGCPFSVTEFKDGIDFSRCIHVGGEPISLWVKKTWWSGMKVKLTLRDATMGPIVVVDDNVVVNGNSFDVNYDDYAFEVVGPTRAPIFQFVIERDYSSVFVNARLYSTDNALILKDRFLGIVSLKEASKPEYNLDRLFKYPSYARKGERE
jgi:hypothetical protein